MTAQQPTKTVRDIYVEALTLTRDQLSQRSGYQEFDPVAVCRELKAIGEVAGYAAVDLLATPDGDVAVVFVGPGGGRIYWTGTEWKWQLNP